MNNSLKQTLFSLTALLAAILSLTPVTARAQGMIVPEPCHRCPPCRDCPVPRPIPPDFRMPTALRVKNIHFATKITDQIAVTHVTQVFENNTPYTLEGTYFFPLPDGVSITEFVMWDGDKKLVGEVRSREEARRIYDSIVRSRRDPALLEYAGKNLFQASIFPINPHSDKKIELTYTQSLNNENGVVGWRYPLGTGWRTNRFTEITPMHGPPAPRPRPGNHAPARISAEIEISAPVNIRDVYSPSHQLSLKRDGDKRIRASFEAGGERAEPDFQLYYTVSNKDLGMSLLTYREPGKDGYFMLRISPKADASEREISAKDVVFVLDTSGSMADHDKIGKARTALGQAVESLYPRDRFSIINFAGEEHLMTERLIAADSEGKKQAREFIANLRAVGGTNINDALMAAFKQITTQSSDRPRMIVLITDGQPTAGETNIAGIRKNVMKANGANLRLFTLGVGYDVNTQLLDGLAVDNRGDKDYIEPNEDIENKMGAFCAKINAPALSDVRIDFGGAQTDLVYPRAIPDVFYGSQLTLIGRYKAGDDRKRQITLSGKFNGAERRFVFDDARFPEKQTERDFLPALWAMRRVGYLMEQITLNGESKELREEVVELGVKYNIVTPYTSYLILEPGMVANQFAVGRPGVMRDRDAKERRAPAAKSAGGGGGGGGGSYVPADANAPPPTSGSVAVQNSKQNVSLQKAEQVSQAPINNAQSQRQNVAGKNFTQQNNIWVDDESQNAKNLKEVKIKFGSDEYFALLKNEPELANYLALGQQVTVVWKGQLYQITE
ncbi:MAG: VIT domain-containing protein [Blastocatellia bacterium]